MADEKKVIKKVPEKKVVKTPKQEMPSLEDLLEAGAHFGHSTKRRHPKMDQYVYAIKNGVQIFDLVKTKSQLAKACEYLTDVVGKGKTVLVMGTKGQAVEIVRTESVRIGIPYVVNRWVGGLLTNWNEIKKRVSKLETMRTKMEAGDYAKYTKKEQVLLKREIQRLERMYGGLVGLKKVPDVIFIVDPTREQTALRESFARDVKIVAICDSNADPEGIEIVIPANDDALKTVEMLVEHVMKAIELGMKKSGAAKKVVKPVVKKEVKKEGK